MRKRMLFTLGMILLITGCATNYKAVEELKDGEETKALDGAWNVV